MTVLESIGPSCRTGLSWVRGVAKQALDFVQPAVNFLKPVVRKVSAVALGLGALFGLVNAAYADGGGYTPVFADPSTITAAATTAFTAIATFMVGVLGFWVIFRLVKRIRG